MDAQRHLIDPSRLVAGAKAVYGEAVLNERYGTIEPVDPDRAVDLRFGELADRVDNDGVLLLVVLCQGDGQVG